MGGILWAPSTAWTFFLIIVFTVPVHLVRSESLFQDLGLTTLPDPAKINISLDEYTRMMKAYLEQRQQNSNSIDSIPELVTFYMGRDRWLPQSALTKPLIQGGTKLKFPVHRSPHQIEDAVLRILAPPMSGSSKDAYVRVNLQVHQILGTRRRRLVAEKPIYLSPNLTKWCDFDITSAVQSWVNGDRNLGLELTCDSCKLRPLQAVISALVLKHHSRFRRNSPYQPNNRRTDCKAGVVNGKKARCCRHNMQVDFVKLGLSELGSIVAPKTYEVGYCQGICPMNYNHATNHSRIQSLMHQRDHRDAKKDKRKTEIPKTCCAPSKLQSLDVLRVNPYNTDKMLLEKWDNMQVIECACS